LKALKAIPVSQWLIRIAISLGYFGFHIVNPVKWTMGQHEFDATLSTKHNIKVRLVQAWEKKPRAEIMTHDPEVQDNLDIGAIRKAASRMSIAHRLLYTQALAGKVYTNLRAHSLGAKVSNQCPLGCQEKDSVEHRTRECKVKPDRMEIPKSITLKHIWRPFISVHTELRIREAHEASFYILRYANGHFSAIPTEPTDFTEGLPFYADDSCQACGTPDAIAAGAATQVYEWGNDNKSCIALAVNWIAPRRILATSFAGEFVRALLAIRDSYQKMTIDIWTDSAALLASWNKVIAHGPQFQNERDGLFKDLILTSVKPDAIILHAQRPSTPIYWHRC
jgi:hypothetical protein